MCACVCAHAHVFRIARPAVGQRAYMCKSRIHRSIVHLRHAGLHRGRRWTPTTVLGVHMGCISVITRYTSKCLSYVHLYRCDIKHRSIRHDAPGSSRRAGQRGWQGRPALPPTLAAAAADWPRSSAGSPSCCSVSLGWRAGSPAGVVPSPAVRITLRRCHDLHRNERAAPSRTARGTPALRRARRAAAVRSVEAHLTDAAPV